MPSTLAQTATILVVGRKPSGESRAFSALDRAACAATATKVDGIGLTPTVRLWLEPQAALRVPTPLAEILADILAEILAERGNHTEAG